MDGIYRIRVKGHLDDRWSTAFDGMSLQREDDGTTVLAGPVVDQAALHGVIARVRDLGLPLLSVKRIAEAHGDAGDTSVMELHEIDQKGAHE